MSKKLIGAVFLSVAMATGAAAQTTSPAGTTDTRADCASNFKSADKNGDNTLDSAEIGASKSVIPTTLGSMSSISMQDFMTACNAASQNTKK